MGQTFCKDCEGRFKRPAVVDANADNEDGSSWDDTTTAGSLRSSPSHSDLVDPRRHNRIKNKKSSVALHAEFRDRQERGVLIAPPLVTEKVMEYTDNVFSGQHLGVEKLYDGGETATSSFGESDADAPQDADNNIPDASVDVDPIEDDDGEEERPTTNPEAFVKTPEEDAFLDLALSDDDNFVFDGMSDRFRQNLKDSMERVVVPRNTLLIRKGDDPDYLYLILEGEVAVYIDPDEYVDDNAVEIGKHAPLDIVVPNATDGNFVRDHEPVVAARREFKQSYVLQLRKSLFQSNFNGGGDTITTAATTLPAGSSANSSRLYDRASGDMIRTRRTAPASSRNRRRGRIQTTIRSIPSSP